MSPAAVHLVLIEDSAGLVGPLAQLSERLGAEIQLLSLSAVESGMRDARAHLVVALAEQLSSQQVGHLAARVRPVRLAAAGLRCSLQDKLRLMDSGVEVVPAGLREDLARLLVQVARERIPDAGEPQSPPAHPPFGLEPSDPGAGPGQHLQGMKVIWVDDDPRRRRQVAEALFAAGALVTPLAPRPDHAQFAEAQALDPEALVMGKHLLSGAGSALAAAARTDVRLRWAWLLVPNWQHLWPSAAGVRAESRLIRRLAALRETLGQLASQARGREPLIAELGSLGPPRLLRALAEASEPRRVTVLNRRFGVQVDIAEGRITGAIARRLDGEAGFDGVHAVGALCMLASGRVVVERALSPLLGNVQQRVGEAIAEALASDIPVPSSIRPRPYATGHDRALSRHGPPKASPL